MKFLKPYTRDTRELIEACRLYERYIRNTVFSASVADYVHGLNIEDPEAGVSAHDAYVRRILTEDAKAGDDAKEGDERITLSVFVLSLRTEREMEFHYTGVQALELRIEKGEWFGALPQVIAEEIVMEGDIVVHEWAFYPKGSLRVKSKTFSWKWRPL